MCMGEYRKSFGNEKSLVTLIIERYVKFLDDSFCTGTGKLFRI